MKSRLEDLPAFASRQATVEAFHYNLVQIALNRLGSPQRFALLKPRTLDLHLEKDAWIVVDRSLNDIPIMAWIDFDTRGRDSLHEDIPCTLKLYHSRASSLIDKIMETMTLLIDEQLKLPAAGATVLPLKITSK